MLNKVPEVTVFFWVIKILCTTVGESVADYINETLGFGLTNTTALMGVLLVIALVAQFRLRRYVASVYWMVVVLVSVVGTLVTDNLTDRVGVDLLISTSAFVVLLALAFLVWYRVEGTLSIHSIVTTRRESFYWAIVLIAFALGTAAGDLLTDRVGFSLIAAVGIYAAAIAVVFAAYRLGMGPILSFWIAYILTRPLGGSTGDYLSGDRNAGGAGLGTLITSLIFLGAISGTVAYLTVTKKDQTEVVYGAQVLERPDEHQAPPGNTPPLPSPRSAADNTPSPTRSSTGHRP
jgi:uncharacterized membrane-anchored protein